MKAIYKQHGNLFTGFLQKHYPNLYLEGIWLCGDWNSALLCESWDLHQNGCGYELIERPKELSPR